jgi:mannosyltransferase
MRKIPVEKFAAGSIFALAVFLRFYRLGDKQLWLDELLQVIHSSPQRFRELLLAITEDRGATPLDYLVQHVFVNVLGHSEFAVRFHAALFGALSIPVLYLLTRDLLDRRTAYLASLLYAVYPLHHHYSQEGRPYSLFTLLTLCSYFAFLKLLRANNVTRQVSYGLITTLLLFSSYFGFWVIVSQIVVLGFLRQRRVRESLRADQTASSFRVFAVPILVSFIVFAPWPIFASKTIYGYQTSPRKPGWELLPLLLREISDRSYPLSVILIGLAGVGAVALKKSKSGQLVLLLSWFLLPIPLIVITVWQREYFFATRQILFTTPALYILVACGILSLPELLRTSQRARSAVRILLVSTVVIISLVVIALHSPDKREDLKGVATFLDERVTAKDVIIAPAISDFLVYYFPRLKPQFRDVATLSEINVLTGNRIFIVNSRYVPAEDRRLITPLTDRTDSSSIRRSDFRGSIQVIELLP